MVADGCHIVREPGGDIPSTRSDDLQLLATTDLLVLL